MLSDVNKDRAFLGQDLSCLVSWIPLESWCVLTAAGKVTHPQTKKAGLIFSFRLRTRKQKFWKGCKAILDEQMTVNFQCEAGARGADAILEQVNKEI